MSDAAKAAALQALKDAEAALEAAVQAEAAPDPASASPAVEAKPEAASHDLKLGPTVVGP